MILTLRKSQSLILLTRLLSARQYTEWWWRYASKWFTAVGWFSVCLTVVFTQPRCDLWSALAWFSLSVRIELSLGTHPGDDTSTFCLLWPGNGAQLRRFILEQNLCLHSSVRPWPNVSNHLQRLKSQPKFNQFSENRSGLESPWNLLSDAMFPKLLS